MGLPELVSNNAGLTKPAAADGMDIVRDFLRTNAAIYGIDRSEVEALHFIGESQLFGDRLASRRKWDRSAVLIEFLREG
jgi:hypothetical protein